MYVIYKLFSKAHNDSLIYIGHTCQGRNRLSKHKHDYKRYLNNNYNYVSSFILFEKYGPNNIDFEIIETIDNNDIKDILIKEKYHINNNDCVNIYNKI